MTIRVGPLGSNRCLRHGQIECERYGVVGSIPPCYLIWVSKAIMIPHRRTDPGGTATNKWLRFRTQYLLFTIVRSGLQRLLPLLTHCQRNRFHISRSRSKARTKRCVILAPITGLPDICLHAALSSSAGKNPDKMARDFAGAISRTLRGLRLGRSSSAQVALHVILKD
jgi:hypothetical protein